MTKTAILPGPVTGVIGQELNVPPELFQKLFAEGKAVSLEPDPPFIEQRDPEPEHRDPQPKRTNRRRKG